MTFRMAARIIGFFFILASSSAQQGQDFYYSNAGAPGYHVTLQQPQRQQQYTNNFYTNNQAPLATSYQNQPPQAHQTNFQPSSFQLPPRPLQQYDPFQPFHTNQHLPQPFHHHVTATPQYDFQDQYYQNEKDLRNQNYFDVHPQGLIDQLDTGSRWRQTDTRKFPTPSPSIDTFVEQSIVNLPLSSTPSVYKVDEDPKVSRIEPSKKKSTRGQSTRGNNLTTYRPRIAASESEIVGLEVSESPRFRNRNKNTRVDSRVIKPTTYTPSSTPSALNRQRSRYTRPNKDSKIESTSLRSEPVRAVRGRGTARVNVNNFFTSQATTPTTTTLSTTVSTTTDPNAEYEFYDYELAPQNEADGPLSIDQLEANLAPPEALLRPNFNLRQNIENNSFYDVLRPFDDLNIPYDKDPKPVVDPYKLVREPSITTFRNKLPPITSTTTTPTPEPETDIYDDTTPKPHDKDQVSPPVNDDKDTPQPTESWVIVASVQTSRSVSGARFLPSDLIKQEEQPKPRTPTGGIERTPKTIEPSTVKPSLNEDEVSPVEGKEDSHKSPVSTESIIDKLDRVQSELSSGILGFRHGDNKLELEPLPDMTSDKIETPTTSATTTTSSTTPATTTTTAATTTISTTTTTEAISKNTEPTTEGTFIRKFVPANKRTTTTGKPSVKKSIFESIEFDDLSPGLLPPGFKQRGFKPKTSRTTTQSPSEKGVQNDDSKHNSREGSGRSTGGTFKNKIKFDEVNDFLPAGYKSTSTTTASPTTTKAKQKSVADLFGKITFDDISAFLPHGYKDKQDKPEKTIKEEKKIEKKPTPKPVEIPFNLLPPGYKSGSSQDNAETKNSSLIDSLLSKVKFKNVDSLLPTNYNKTSAKTEAPETTTNKVVFPTRPGTATKTSPPRSPGKTKSGGGLSPVLPKINKGWPVRTITEFTGWPSPATTAMSISVQEILAAAKAASATSTSTTTSSTTTTTTTTTTTPRPTTPGICSEEACDMAATIRLVGPTAKWLPELGDHNTIEYQQMATDIENQLNIIYSSSESLSRWYKKINIDSFSPGSILVDYFVELSEIGKSVNTADMKRIFHDSLQKYTSNQEALSNNLRSINSTMEFKLGRFNVDPKYTDFRVLPRRVVPTVGFAEEDELLPQWAIAVIVIGLASLLFVIIFGVTVLVNRHKGAKKKQPVGLTEDMLHELNKNHLGGLDNFGADDLYNMEDVWNEKPIKKRSSGSIQDNSMANLYDSWRSEWNGYYYNGYYGNGSSTSGYSRRRSDYDTNF